MDTMKSAEKADAENEENGKNGSTVKKTANGNTEADDLRELLVNDKSAPPEKFCRTSSRQRKQPLRYQSPVFSVKPSVIPKTFKKSDPPKKPEKRAKRIEEKENVKRGRKALNSARQNDQKMTEYEKMIQKNIEERNVFIARMMEDAGYSFEKEKKPMKKRNKFDLFVNDEKIEAVPMKKQKRMAPKKKKYSNAEEDESEITYNTRSRECGTKTRGMYREISSSDDSMTENDYTLDTVSEHDEDDEDYKNGPHTRIKTRRWKKEKTDRIVTRNFALLQQKREERKGKKNSENSENNEIENQDDNEIKESSMATEASDENGNNLKTLALKEDQSLDKMDIGDEGESGEAQFMEEDNKENLIPEPFLEDFNGVLPLKKQD